MMEARVGIEPTSEGFADLSLATWVPRHCHPKTPALLGTPLSLLSNTPSRGASTSVLGGYSEKLLEF